MNDQPPTSTAAPADLRPHPPWPRWRKIVAYIIFVIIALASAWFIDRRVDSLANDPPPARMP